MRVTSLAVAIISGLFAVTAGVTAGPDADAKISEDLFLWLEQVDGAKATEWVKAENAKTAAVLDTDPRYAGLFKQALELAEAKDRIPRPRFIGGETCHHARGGHHTPRSWARTRVPGSLPPRPPPS